MCVKMHQSIVSLGLPRPQREMLPIFCQDMEQCLFLLNQAARRFNDLECRRT